MCRVQYTLCPGRVDCSEATPVTGNIQLCLPGNKYTLLKIKGVLVTVYLLLFL